MKCQPAEIKYLSRSDIAFHPDGGRLIALGGEDGAVEIFDTATLRLAAVLKSFSKLIQSIAWHPLAEQYKGITKNKTSMAWILL